MLQGSASPHGPIWENSKFEESTPSRGPGCSLSLGAVTSQCSSPVSDCSTSASQSRKQTSTDVSRNPELLFTLPRIEVPSCNRYQDSHCKDNMISKFFAEFHFARRMGFGTEYQLLHKWTRAWDFKCYSLV